MTVPFRPGGVDPGPDFLSTLTRSFLQTRALVDEDTERKRDRQRFETEQIREKQRMESLAQEMELRSRLSRQEQRERDIGAARDRSVLDRGEIQFERPEAPFPEAEAPPGAGIANELADALQGVQEQRQVGPVSEITPEGVVPVRGQPGTFVDLNAEQRESERSRAQEAVFVSDRMEEAAASAEEAGDSEEAARIRGAIPRAVLDVQQGRTPDTSALLRSRELRETPTAAQQETIDRRETERVQEVKTQREDAAIEEALQRDAQAKLQARGDPAGVGAYVEGRDYDRQLTNALEAERRQETARTGVAARQALSLRDAIALVKEDPSVWTPNAGLKISATQLLRMAEGMVESSNVRGATQAGITQEGDEPFEEVEVQVVSQEEFDLVVEEMGEEYAALYFQVGG